MNNREKIINILVEKKDVFRGSVLMIAFLVSALLLTGCMASYRNVRDINQLPADRAATIRVVINASKEGKILQEEIEKDYWRIAGRRYPPYPILNYEWYLWLAMDQEIFPLIPKDRTFIRNVGLIHEGDVVNVTREYPVPTGKHMYWLEFAAMRPYVFTIGSSEGGGITNAAEATTDGTPVWG